MTTNKKPPCGISFRALAWPILWMLLAVSVGKAQPITVSPYHKSGIYETGEKVGWTLAVSGNASVPSGNFAYTIKKNNQDLIQSGEINLASGKAGIEVTLDEPAMLFTLITPPAGATNSASGTQSGLKSGEIGVGAAVSATKLQPCVARPADFDAFWESKIKILEQTPANATLTPADSGSFDVEYGILKMDNIEGGHIYGQLAKPKKEGKFPVLIIFQWAGGPYPLQRSWVTDHAAKGWLTLNIEPHDVLPTEAASYYQALPQSLKNYQTIGREDRDKCYFLKMYLADYRAVDYIASRPDWDGKTLVVMGTSMGGQQSLCVAGLNSKVTHLIVNEPAGCDSNGPLHGRAPSYPNWPSNNPKIMETALYFDPVNFAPHIKATSLVAMGFVDTIASPAGIWTAYNQIPGPKEAAPMIDSPHNNYATAAQQRPYTERSAEWLDKLVKGGAVTPRETAALP